MEKSLMVPSYIKSTQEPESSSGLNVLIYGVSKVGKTSLATSIINHPSVVKALHVDIDGSPDSLIPSAKLDRAAIPSGATGWDTVEEIANYLSSGNHDYNAIILDTITTLGAYGLDSVLEKNFLKAKRPGDARLAFPAMGDYGINNRRCIRLVRFFRELSLSRGWHVIMISHEKETKLETGAITYRPALSGAAGEVIPGIPDMVCRLTQPKNGKRVLQLASSAQVVADYRRPPSVKRTIPELLTVSDCSNQASEGVDLAKIWTMILNERASA